MKSANAELEEKARKVKEMHAKRNNVFQEFVKGEQKYCDDLQLLDMFRTALQGEDRMWKDKAPPMAEYECQTIFGKGQGLCLDKLIEVTQTLWENVKEAADPANWNVHHTLISNIFNSDPKLLTTMSEVYSKYNANLKSVQAKVRELLDKKNKKTNPKVTDLIHALEAREQCKRQQLMELVQRPNQRIMRYPMLMKALIECTTDKHPDRHGLESAFQNLEQHVALVDTGVEAIERKVSATQAAGADLRELQLWTNKIVAGDKFLKHGRAVIAELPCKAISIASSTGKERKEGNKGSVTIYLLNDMILVCSGHPPKKARRASIVGEIMRQNSSSERLGADHDGFYVDDVALIEPVQVDRKYQMDGHRCYFKLDWWARDEVSKNRNARRRKNTDKHPTKNTCRFIMMHSIYFWSMLQGIGGKVPCYTVWCCWLSPISIFSGRPSEHLLVPKSYTLR